MTLLLFERARRVWRESWQAGDSDLLLALAAFVGLLIDPVFADRSSNLTPLAGVLALVTASPLVYRRRFPLGVLFVETPLLLVCLAAFHPNRAAAGVVMLLAFTVGSRGRRSVSLAVGALMALAVTAAVLLTAKHGSPGDVVAYFALVVGAMVVGDAVRARRALHVAIAEEAEREREALTQHRFDEERLNWAHELHDILGHALVAINIRASAAAHRERQHRDGDTATALDEIAAVSSEALTELRSTLKNLRNTSGESAPLHPLQDLTDLPELVAGVEQAGLAVDLEMSTASSGVPPTVGHAGYRIVQEGLTNVLRHSTAQRASVRVGVDDGALMVEVFDAGAMRANGERHGGHGVRGMKERTVALGGSCEVGAVDGAGWRVRARIPLAGQDR